MRLSGPPVSFAEHKALAEKVLRSEITLAGIDELSSPSGIVLSAQHLAALISANIDHHLIPEVEAIHVAEVLLADPRKNFSAAGGGAPVSASGERVPLASGAQ